MLPALPLNDRPGKRNIARDGNRGWSRGARACAHDLPDRLPTGFRPGPPKRLALLSCTTARHDLLTSVGAPTRRQLLIPLSLILEHLLAWRVEALDDFMECCRAWRRDVPAA